jgi:hypothetical protein
MGRIDQTPDATNTRDGPRSNGDEVYGSCTQLRDFLEARGQGYVLRVQRNFRLTLASGRRLTCADAASQLLARNHPEVRSAEKGSKGERWYAWSWLAAASPQHCLLIRRHLKTGDLAFHYCFVPQGQPLTLSRLIRAAGLRWPVEVGHPWCRSRCAAFSRLCSLFLAGFLLRLCPAGAGVEAGRACPAFA